MNPLFIIALSIVITFICLMANRAWADTNPLPRLRLAVSDTITLTLTGAPTNNPFTISASPTLPSPAGRGIEGEGQTGSSSSAWVPLLEARSNSWGTITIVLPKTEPIQFYRFTNQ